ncbi:hypothetical protein AYL99_10271 [Fonsecaea erecta]|uniref:Uncharacterized protein n=1 Tax=Fonsecaea erecta TaxID=1367422 RepID=A0A178Z695_9EURO|nr:hypothetical protein AYL99_10271 [Fonsecaea erecta]OAP55298.1 hypothetical protein AYL99_10271 [Fonsecaea erecta]
MPVEASLSAAMTEEVSGWWLSERSAKARFKAFLGRAKLEKLTRQKRAESTSLHSNMTQSVYSGRVAPAPRVADANEYNGNTTYSSSALCSSQQHESLSRWPKAQRNLTSSDPMYRQPLVAEPVYDEAGPHVTPRPAMYGKTSRNVSRSTTDSSVHTLNSVDFRTEPSLSDSHSVYTTHTSFSSYTSSSSYAAAEPPFKIADSDEVSTRGDSRLGMSTPTPEDSGVSCMYMHTPKKNNRPFASLITTPGHLVGANSYEEFVHKPLPPIPASSRQLDRNDRRISTVAPLPGPGHVRKMSARYRCEPPDAMSRSVTPTPPSSRPSSARSRSSSHRQDSVEGGRRRVPSYSLFPRTPSTGQQKLPINGIPSPPAITQQCNLRCLDKSTDAEREDLTHPPSPPLPSRDPRRHGKVLSSGTDFAPGLTRELQTSQIPAAGDEVSPRPTLRTADIPRRSVIPRQKSMPCLVRPRTPSLGPPPNEPLPALPLQALGRLPLPRRFHHER